MIAESTEFVILVGGRHAMTRDERRQATLEIRRMWALEIISSEPPDHMSPQGLEIWSQVCRRIARSVSPRTISEIENPLEDE